MPATLTKPLPLYQCHKEVRALKIVMILHAADKTTDGVDYYELIPEDESYDGIPVTESWMKRTRPMPGGYYMQFQDGWTDFVTSYEFEAAYTRIGEQI